MNEWMNPIDTIVVKQFRWNINNITAKLSIRKLFVAVIIKQKRYTDEHGKELLIIWFREREQFWINLREINSCSDSKFRFDEVFFPSSLKGKATFEAHFLCAPKSILQFVMNSLAMNYNNLTPVLASSIQLLYSFYSQKVLWC